MEMGFKKYLLAGTMLAGSSVLGGISPAAAAVCPAIGADSDCALIIDITSVSGGVGTYTVSKGPSFAQGPYDGVEDTLLGVTNRVPSRFVLEFDWRGLRLDEDTWSGSKVNRRIGEFLGQAVPSVHFAHSDLT